MSHWSLQTSIFPKFTTFSYRVWKHFDLSNMTKPKVKNLRRLVLAPNIPINQLRAQIANFKHITSNADRLWIYYVRRGSGSGLILLIMICCLLYWCCKRTQKFETRPPACVAIADPENPDMMHTRAGAIGTNRGSGPGKETVRIQDPAGTQHTVLRNDMQFAFASTLLDQPEDYGANVREHCRRLRDSNHTTKTLIEAKPSLEIQDVYILTFYFHPTPKLGPYNSNRFT